MPAPPAPGLRSYPRRYVIAFAQHYLAESMGLEMRAVARRSAAAAGREATQGAGGCMRPGLAAGAAVSTPPPLLTRPRATVKV